MTSGSFVPPFDFPARVRLDVSDSSKVDQLIMDAFYRNPENYPHWRSANVNTDASVEEFVINLKGKVYSFWSEHYSDMYLGVIHENHLLLADINKKGMGSVSVGAADIETAGKILRDYMERLPPREEVDESIINMDYWSLNKTTGGGSIYTRKIGIRRWNESQGNYPTPVREKLQSLIDIREKDIKGGKLVLWHGKPGTGKSNAILALANEWRQWCKVQYVLDPEMLFSSAGYMIDVLTRGEDEVPEWEDPGPDHGKYRILIVEDSEEFLKKDAKAESGQGLSRLLNATDGLIGQGMRCLILITTNENVQNFHEAVIRPGRCLANIEFIPFNADEAKEWAFANDLISNDDFGSTTTLAELYAKKNEAEVIKTKEEERHTGQYL